MNTSTRVLPVPDACDGERVDAALVRMLGFSRTFAAAVCEDGGVTIDGRQAKKSDRLSLGQVIEVSWVEPDSGVELVALDHSDLRIVFEDSDIVVVDKPAGIAAHPSPGWNGPTVVGVLLARGVAVSTSGASERQGVVHRLDAGTSGLMVVAKSERAYTSLKAQFHDREVHKIYHALAQGHPDPFRGTIDSPIGRHPTSEWKFSVRADGKSAITHYDTIEAHPGATLVEVKLETGRTHQIRVHFAAIRHPLVGDTMYGADPTMAESLELGRQWLHAVTLGFTHPGTGDWAEFSSEYSPDLEHALSVVRGEELGDLS